MIGQDRPGILAAVSQVLFEQRCNIESVSQTLLQSVFGALLMVALPDELDEPALQSCLRAKVAALSLDVFVRSYPREATRTAPPAEPFVVTSHGPDRPGIIAAITGVFARHAANVTDLQAVFEGGASPDRNATIFQVDVPQAVDLPAFYAELRQIAASLGLELNIQHRRLFEMMNRI